jgi:hypothetical protein
MMLLMPDEARSSVRYLPKEKFRVLAEANGWSLEHARGYVDGEAFRLRGKQPSKYALVGIDEYCLGFRAGYYQREAPELSADVSAPPAAQQ